MNKDKKGEKDPLLLSLERQEQILQMELLDVLTDLSTPDNSDAEGEEIDERVLPTVRQALLEVKACPTRWTQYAQLYQCPTYKAKAEKKVRKMKNMVKRCTLSEVMLNQRFTTALQLIEEVYPDDGGRAGINSLVACHHVINPEN
jgi:hypothetical protein